ncbi:hypothetical protein ACEE23_05865 [Corynebacterium sp. 32222D000AT]|uniref:hypothetical protein n=1 Tax=unclassified Corynebacterium TaxID=2624378 RepID=UPI002A97A741|nr:hypothetical protein [Mycobacteriaceae bacterium]MDY5828574.1 hypothetical protein [Corynebacterium sp.]
MTLAFDDRRIANTEFAAYRTGSRTPSVVPAAAVWEPSVRDFGDRQGAPAWSGHGPAGVGSRYSRTLTLDNRTDRRSQPALSAEDFAGQPRGMVSEQGRQKGNYALGAVFGCAVFLGTLAAGMGLVDGPESASSMGAVDSAITQQAHLN